MTTTLEAKRQGQTRSLHRVDNVTVRTFLAWVRALPAGTDVSVNDLRRVLDGNDVPNRARGGLFRRAVVEELLDPLEVSAPGYVVPVKIPSTGHSAHRALVQVYRRTDTS